MDVEKCNIRHHFEFEGYDPYSLKKLVDDFCFINQISVPFWDFAQVLIEKYRRGLVA